MAMSNALRRLDSVTNRANSVAVKFEQRMDITKPEWIAIGEKAVKQVSGEIKGRW